MYSLRRSQIIYKENPDRILYYTTSDGNISTPRYTASSYWGGANIVSNTYKNGVGKLMFDRDLTAVGGYVFTNYNNSTLRTVKFPSKVSNISSDWFNGNASQLTDVEVDNNNATYETPANSHCVIKKSNNELIIGVSNTVIPSSVRKIGVYAFSSVSFPSTFVIPEGVTELASNSFSGITKTQLEIPSTVNNIDATAFRGAFITIISVNSNNTTYNDANGSNCIMKTANSELIYLPRNNYTIPSTARIIGAYACYYNNASSLIVPEGVTLIKDHAFENQWNSSLTSITLPSTLETIENNGLYYTRQLNTITCNATTAPSVQGSTFYYCGNGASGTKKLIHPASGDYSTWLSNSAYYLGYYGWTEELTGYIIEYTTSDNQAIVLSDEFFDANIISNTYIGSKGVIIFDGPVTSIDSSAFKNQNTLVTINFKGIPDLDTIGDSLFYGCSALTTISNLPTLTTIPAYMYYGCSALSGHTNLTGITSIGDYAYYGNSFTTINVPNTVTTIGDYAFANTSLCTKYSFTAFTSVPTLGTNGFDNIDPSAKIIVKQDMETAFKAATNWSTYSANIEGIQYTELSCLKQSSSEDAWIELDEANADDIVIELKFNVPSCSHSGPYDTAIVGWWKDGDNVAGNYRVLIFDNNTIFDQYYWSNRVQNYSSLLNGDHIVKLVTYNSTTGNIEMHIDNTVYSASNRYRYYDSTHKLGLFGGYYSNAVHCLDENSKLYYFKLWKNNQLIYDLIPVLDNTNVACMYNRVDDSFWYSEGGQFLYETL